MKVYLVALIFLFSCAAPHAPAGEKRIVEEARFPWERGIPVVVHELEDGCTNRVDCPEGPMPTDDPRRFELMGNWILHSTYSPTPQYVGLEVGDQPLSVFAVPIRDGSSYTNMQIYEVDGLEFVIGISSVYVRILDGSYADTLEEIVEPTFVGHLEDKPFATISYAGDQAFADIVANHLEVMVEPPPITITFWFFYDDFRVAVKAEVDSFIFRDHTVTTHRKYLVMIDGALCEFIDRHTTDICNHDSSRRPHLRYSEPFPVEIPTLEYKSAR